MTRVNSTNWAGTERFVVDSDPSKGNYTTIQSAIDVASLTGNATIWINPGFYSENLVFGIGNYSIVGNAAYKSYSATIDGNCTFTNHTGNFTFENLNFNAAAGDIITVTSNSASSGSLYFNQCTFNSQAGKCVVATATAPAQFNVDLNRCDSQGSTGNIVLDGPLGSNINYCGMNTNTGDVFDLNNGANISPFYTPYNSGSGHGATIRGTTCNFISLHCAGSFGLELVNFLAAGQAIVAFMGFSSSAPSGYWATGAGTLIYGGIGVGGKSVDPVTTQLTLGFQPFATAGTSGTAVAGACGFDSTSFAVSPTGFVTFTGSSGGFPSTSITANQTLAVNNGYYVALGSLSLALPATSAVGDIIKVTLTPSGTSWTITQGVGQQIFVGAFGDSSGVSGSAASSSVGDSVTLECIVANTIWVTTSVIGSITLT